MQVTIHQPDFLPWLGFFNKISNCDYWIVLDHVKNNPRDSAFWGRRVRMLINGKPEWLSIPLNRPTALGEIGIPINKMVINTNLNKQLKKLPMTIRMAYSKSPFFSDYFPFVESWFIDKDPNLMMRNMIFIKKIMKILDIKTKIIFSSDFATNSKSTQLLVDLIKNVGGDIYRCGGGANGYQDDDLFIKNGITLKHNNFLHPVYPQIGEQKFIEGLSIIDALFNVGRDQVMGWMHSK